MVNELDYLNKMKQFSFDETKFKKLIQNPTKSSLLTYLRKLRKDGNLDDATYPVFSYGLPKVPKSGCPFRPIVPSVNTYNYNPASYLVSILQPISTNQFTVKENF